MAGEQGQEAPKSKRPKDSPFTQQRLDAWQPILLPKNVVVVFSILGACFLGFGIWMIAESNSVVEYVKQYDGAGTGSGEAGCKLVSDDPSTCMVSFNVKEEMKQPVFLYYQLDNFYQNHRRYVKSRSDAQLRGEDVDASSLSDCEPLVMNGTKFVRNPCGLIAASMFNDTFSVTTGQTMREDNIAWESDKKAKFKKNPAFPSPNVFWLNFMFPGLYNGALDQEGVTNEHFIVWMRTAALPSFRKLYGRFETTIPKDTTVSFNVTTRFRVDLFEGKKSLVLSTTSTFGGKNPFLGIAYVVVAGLCFVLALVFGVKQCLCPRQLGSAGSLNWK